MKTKIFTLLLAVAASIGTMNAAIVNGTCGNNLTWSLNTRDSTLTIEGYGTMTSTPWKEHISFIAYISLPDGLTNIRDNAFSDCVISTISIPTSVNSIGMGAFMNCTHLLSIEIPEGVTRIESSTFCGCVNLTSVSIPNGVTYIGGGNFYNVFGAFQGCTSLSSVILPNSVTTIGEGAFYKCGLASIEIPNTITEINDYTFCECRNLSSVTIPNSVEILGACAFKRCTNLHTIEIPNSVTRIKRGAFADCNSLASIIIPRNVTNIGKDDLVYIGVFEGCNNLKSVTWNAINCTNFEPSYWGIGRQIDTFIIGNEVAYIPESLCSGLANLTSIIIPNSVTNIGNSAFSNCGLTSIICEAAIPPSLSSNSFSNMSLPLFVPAESVEAYQNALYWEEFTDIRAIGSAPLVQFLDWDGTILSSANVTIGTAATPPANPTREGYTFIGWDKDFSNITEDLTVTALYKINRYKVDFLDWDETILKTDSVDYNNPAYAPANPLREGHEFIGWDKDFSHITSDMTIKAQYAVNYYPVGFLNYDGTLLSEQSIAYNQAAMAPIVPAREGYTFIGWTADIEHITARTFAIALYEKQNLLLVTYKKEDGEIISSENVDLHLPEAPSITGKTFAGWLTESASNTEGVIFRATYTLDNPTESGDVTIEPSSTTAGVTFPYITGAMTYVLVIRDLFGHVVCKIMFNSTGHLLGIAFAPGRNNVPQQEQSTGFNFTVEGLTPNTTYEYEFTAHDEADQIIETLSGSFSTTADEIGVNNISPLSAPHKIINEGNVLILRGDKTYTLQGQEIK